MSKAIERQRLLESVRLVGASPSITDFELADKEWSRNTQHMKAPGWGIQPAKPTDDLFVGLDELCVFTDRDIAGHTAIATVILGIGDGDDPDTTLLIPMTPEVARLVASKILLCARDCGEEITKLFGRSAR